MIDDASPPEPATPTIALAERLRADFDGSFAEPLREASAGARDFVLVAAGGAPWALALKGLGGIEHGRVLVPLPSSRAALLGVAGVRNAAVPVFDLAALLGAGKRDKAAADKASLLTLFAVLETSPGQAVGVAFERLLQFARVAPEAIFAPASLASAQAASSFAARPTLHHEDEVYAIVEAEELLREILADDAARDAPAKAAREGSTESAAEDRARDERLNHRAENLPSE